MDNDFIDENFVYGKDIEKINNKKKIILDCLKNVIDPDLNKNIIELNFVKNLKIFKDNINEKYNVNFDLNLTTPACPVKDILIKNCENELKLLDWINNININLTYKNNVNNINNNIMQNIILIYSCKGGVGKSFFSVNFAFYLKKKGAKVGLLDADINGPSFSSLLPFEYHYAKFKKIKKEKNNKKNKIFYDINNIDNINDIENIEKINNIENINNIDNINNINYVDNIDNKYDMNNDKNNMNIDELYLIDPLIYNDVKLMSYSYIKNKENLGFSPFRGIILNEIIEEFFNNVNWGILDYLIIDMPPGTNDIHLDLFKKNKVDGIIMITTPNNLSTNDVLKGINMCNYFNIPIISLIINMNYFVCDNCNKKHFLLNNIKLDFLKDKIPNIHDIPFDPLLAKNVYYVNNEKKFPFILAYNNDNNLINKLEEIFEDNVRKIAILKYNNENMLYPCLQIYNKNFLQLSFDRMKKQYIFSEDILIYPIKKLRLKCKCDMCEITKKEKKKKNISNYVHIKEIKNIDNYNVKIIWSDNHYSVFSYVYLKHIFTKNNFKNEKKSCDIIEETYEW